MRELWLVAKREYLTRVRQRSFRLGLLAVPLLIVVSLGVAFLLTQGRTDSRPLGYVDQSGVLAAGVSPALEEGEEPIAMRAFADPQAAQAALEAQEIQAYYLLPPDYLSTREVTLTYLDRGPSASAQNAFRQYVRANLLAGQPIAERSWAQEGPALIIRSVDGTRDWSPSNISNAILPFLVGFFFFFAVMTSASYMLEAVTEEKESRTLEILTTSMTPEQLIGGKALGLMGVALTQTAIWVGAVAAAVLIARPRLPFLSSLQIPWGLVAIFLLYFLPSFALITGMMITVGGAVGDHRQGQQIAGILNLLFVLPMWFSAIVFINPDHAGLVGLTLFPTTAMLTIMFRWGVTILPLWQLIVSWVLLVTVAGLSLWAAARIFRLGMLRYGQGLNVREALAGLRVRKNRSERG